MTPVPASQIVEQQQRSLVARSRHEAQNSDYAVHYLRTCRNNIVGGPGIVLQGHIVDVTGKLDSELNPAIEASFKAWGRSRSADIRGKLNFREIQKACVNNAARDGEFFVRAIHDASPHSPGFSLRIIDPQKCPVDLSSDVQPDGRYVRNGIEFDQDDRPRAYYFEKPNASLRGQAYGSRDFIRVPADDVCHGFIEEFPDQLRGIPWMATSLARIHQLSGFEEAALINARSSANKTIILKRVGDEHGEDEDEDDIRHVELVSEPGTIPVYPSNTEIHNFNPQYPNGEYRDFRSSILRAMSTGFGINYNNFANDLEGVNYSSIRSGLLAERETWIDLQNWLASSLCDFVYRHWLKTALLTSSIKVKGTPVSPARYSDLLSVEWQGRRWAWVDPLKDAQGAVLSKDNMLTSPGRIIRGQGIDPHAVWREYADDAAAQRRAFLDAGFDRATADQLTINALGVAPKTLINEPQGSRQNDQ